MLVQGEKGGAERANSWPPRTGRRITASDNNAIDNDDINNNGVDDDDSNNNNINSFSNNSSDNIENRYDTYNTSNL